MNDNIVAPNRRVGIAVLNANVGIMSLKRRDRRPEQRTLFWSRVALALAVLAFLAAGVNLVLGWD